MHDRNVVIEKIIDLNKCCYKKDKYFDKNLFIETCHQSDFSFVKLKEKLKKSPKFYQFLIKIISSVYFSEVLKKALIKRSVKLHEVVLDLASGNRRLHQNIINVDLYKYPNVDIISDATNLCIKSNSIDLVINDSCLEHVYDYKSLVGEVYRILRSGGKAYFSVPFIYEFHASPNDYHRFTEEGLKNLFEEFNFKVKKIEVLGGPASSFVNITTEFLAILLSFNCRFLYSLLMIFFMLLLWPIKFLDFFLNKVSFSKNIASIFCVVVEKGDA